jgi:hypothetical protein
MRQEDLLSQQREREDKERLAQAGTPSPTGPITCAHLAYIGVCFTQVLERLEFLRFIYTPYRSMFTDDDMETVLWPGPQFFK